MKILKILLTISLFFSASLFANLDKEGVLGILKGKYKVDGDYRFSFVIRSSGNVMFFDKDDEYATGNLFMAHSDGEWDFTGLPVAHLVFGSGSDEDTRDIHIILAAVRDGFSGSTDEIHLMGAFETFNDGPNGYSSAKLLKIKLNKYDKTSKRYKPVL